MAQQMTKFSAGAEREDRPHGYGRFYSAFRKLIIRGDPEETKRVLVSQYTGGRTDSLKGMTLKEYTDLCNAIEEMNGTRNELRHRRSTALKLIQELGVDTTDWAQINDFCRHPRIAGKAFGQLSIEELTELATRLRSIKRKGWQRAQPGDGADGTPKSTLILLNMPAKGSKHN